jgi:hypothetical protein
MNKKNTIITDWLDKHGDPQIEKRVMERLDKITKELIIDEAYALYLNESRIYNYPESFIVSKEEFINKIKTNPEFSERWGLKIEERELSHKERINISWSIFFPDRKDENIPDWWNVKTLTMDEKRIPTKLITITYNDKTIESYE